MIFRKAPEPHDRGIFDWRFGLYVDIRRLAAVIALAAVGLPVLGRDSKDSFDRSVQ
jgi:hypothetical protein